MNLSLQLILIRWQKEAGAEVDPADEFGKTALDVAEAQGNATIVEILRLTYQKTIFAR
jgi:hypothetical protein